jgi:hypothetical protein
MVFDKLPEVISAITWRSSSKYPSLSLVTASDVEEFTVVQTLYAMTRMNSLDMEALSSDSRFISLSQKHVLLGGGRIWAANRNYGHL